MNAIVTIRDANGEPHILILYRHKTHWWHWYWESADDLWGPQGIGPYDSPDEALGDILTVYGLTPVTWSCPKCEAEHHENLAHNDRAWCPKCMRSFDWGVVLGWDEGVLPLVRLRPQYAQQGG